MNSIKRMLAPMCAAFVVLTTILGTGVTPAMAKNSTEIWEQDTWVITEDWSFTVAEGATFAQSKTFQIQLPEGHDKDDFQLHMILTLDAGAVNQLNRRCFFELNNHPRCDTSEIQFHTAKWKEGVNDVVIPFSTSYPGSALEFSTDALVQHFRIFSTSASISEANYHFSYLAIERKDKDGMRFQTEDSDTFLTLSKPVAQTPATTEITVKLSATEANYTVTGTAAMTDVTIGNADKAVFSTYAGVGEYAGAYALYVLADGRPALVWDHKQHTFDVNVRTGEAEKLALVHENDAVTLCVNGVAVQTTEAVMAEPLSLREIPAVGANVDGSNRYDSSMRDLRLWSDVRTAAELAATTTVDGTEQGLIAAWTLEGNITHILDTLPDLAGDNDIVYKGTRRDQWVDYVVPTDEIGDDYYTFVFVPDPQNVTISKALQQWEDTTDWIAANIDTENIVHVSCAGDNTWNADVSTYQTVADGFAKFWDRVSWNSLMGNHDYPLVSYRDSRNYNEVLGLDTIMSTASKDAFQGWYDETGINTYGTYMSGTENCYYTLEIGETKWLLLQLEYEPRLSVLTWAESVLKEYADYNVMLQTHGYVYDGGGYGNRTMSYSDQEKEAGDFGGSSETIYTRLVQPYSNIKMVLCGHSQNTSGNGGILTRNLQREDGSVVYQMMINAQKMDTDDRTNYVYYDDRAVGMLSLLRFSADGSKVAVQWFCPTDDMSYEPNPNGNNPDTTLGANSMSLSNFVLNLDKTEETALDQALTALPDYSGVQSFLDEEKLVNFENAVSAAKDAEDTDAALAQLNAAKDALFGTEEAGYVTFVSGNAVNDEDGYVKLHSTNNATIEDNAMVLTTETPNAFQLDVREFVKHVSDDVIVDIEYSWNKSIVYKGNWQYVSIQSAPGDTGANYYTGPYYRQGGPAGNQALHCGTIEDGGPNVATFVYNNFKKDYITFGGYSKNSITITKITVRSAAVQDTLDTLSAAIYDAGITHAECADPTRRAALSAAIDAAETVVLYFKDLAVIEAAADNLAQAVAVAEGADTADKAALVAVLEQIPAELSDYTRVSVAALNDIVRATKSVLADADATQETVNAAAEAVTAAAEGLVKRAEKTALRAAISYSRRDLSAYSEDVVQAYLAAVDAARPILADADATQESVDAALLAVTVANDALEAEIVVVPFGDVNGDEKVDSTDARMTLQYFVGSIDENALDLTAADVDGNGKVDSTDARLILQKFVGSITEFPAEQTE